jgi:hypothetical protein
MSLVRPGRLRGALVRLALAGCGLVFALSLAECALRVVGYAGAGERVQRRFDRRYGEVPRDSWIWHFDIDRARHRAVELRGRQFALPRPPNERRVLFLGDSATEGAFVGEDECYPRVFESLMAARGQSVRVINAGVWGMTTIDELHLLEDKLLPLEPNMVVIGLFMANDLNMNLAHRERVQQRAGAWGALTQSSALVHFLRLRMLALGARGRRGAQVQGELTPVELKLVDERGLRLLSYPEGELATYVQPESRSIRHAYEVLRSVLATFQRLSNEHGFSLRVLLIPSPSRVLGRLAVLHYPRLLAELSEQGLQISPASIDVDAPTRRVLSLCAELAIACVDPAPALMHLGPRAFFPADEHPTAPAHRVLAQALLASP